MRTSFSYLCCFGAASLAGCAHDPDMPAARTAFDQAVPIEIPSWASKPTREASSSAPAGVHQTIHLGATETESREADPAAPAPVEAMSHAPADGPLHSYNGDGFYGAYGYYGVYGAYGYGGAYSAYHRIDATPSQPSRSSSDSPPKTGGDWPAVNNYGPSFPFTWANPMP